MKIKAQSVVHAITPSVVSRLWSPSLCFFLSSTLLLFVSYADTSFMYIITCLGIVKLYQTRHPDIAANAHSVYAGFALIILIAVIGVVRKTAHLPLP